VTDAGRCEISQRNHGGLAYHSFMSSPTPKASPNEEMVATSLLLRGALAIQEDLLSRLDERPKNQSLRKQVVSNEELVDRLIWGYHVAISRYLSCLAKSQLVS
jgi:hypothetical protein